MVVGDDRRGRHAGGVVEAPSYFLTDFFLTCLQCSPLARGSPRKKERAVSSLIALNHLLSKLLRVLECAICGSGEELRRRARTAVAFQPNV